jgi:hypothetical protein
MTLEKRKGIPAKKGYYIKKTGERIRYDSMTELAMMMYLDTGGTEWKKNTTLRIPYEFEGKQRKYIPDFILEADKFTPAVIIEIKGSNDKPELPYKIEAAYEYCKHNRMMFSLMPYDEVRKLIDWKLVQEYHKKQEENGIHS